MAAPTERPRPAARNRRKHAAVSRRITVLIAAVLALLSCAPAHSAAETRLMVVSDLHYMAPALRRRTS